jgi:hypothetical protein
MGETEAGSNLTTGRTHRVPLWCCGGSTGLLGGTPGWSPWIPGCPLGSRVVPWVPGPLASQMVTGFPGGPPDSWVVPRVPRDLWVPRGSPGVPWVRSPVFRGGPLSSRGIHWVPGWSPGFLGGPLVSWVVPWVPGWSLELLEEPWASLVSPLSGSQNAAVQTSGAERRTLRNYQVNLKYAWSTQC